MPTDKYEETARRLIVVMRKFQIAALDEPVGDDTDNNLIESITEYLRQQFPVIPSK